MSASILYTIVKPVHAHQIGCWAPSSFMKSMEKAFDDFPCLLDEDNIETLKGMEAAFGEAKYGEAPNPYKEIIKAIERHGAIRIYSEF